MLRVAFTSEFKRGRLQDLVALLSGRNFETREYEEKIAEASFTTLRKGILNFMNETYFKRLLMILRTAGFVDKSMISSQNVINAELSDAFWNFGLPQQMEGIEEMEVEDYDHFLMKRRELMAQKIKTYFQSL